MTSPSKNLSAALCRILDHATGTRVGSLRFRPLGGGSINTAYQVVTSDNSLWFCKINDARAFPDLFAREGQGLELLGRQGQIRVPAVVACEEVDGMQVLVLEWIAEGPRTEAFWTRFGEQLAGLHQGTNNFRSPGSSPQPVGPGSAPSSPGPEFAPSLPDLTPPNSLFGLDRDNYMGSLPQSNTPSADWPGFFIQQRLQPQLRLSVDKGLLDAAAVRKFEALYQVLPDIFAEDSPPSGLRPEASVDPSPAGLSSLLHGDLWCGNFLCDEHSRPVLIDPAVYYGHRSMDLAMTTLFGGFEPGFYEAYNHHYPFPANYRQQWEICNLYPLLVHLNLFGVVSGKGAGPKDSPFSESIDVGPSVRSSVTTFSYIVNILRTIQRF